jgi:hypothetical protein
MRWRQGLAEVLGDLLHQRRAQQLMVVSGQHVALEAAAAHCRPPTVLGLARDLTRLQQQQTLGGGASGVALAGAQVALEDAQQGVDVFACPRCGGRCTSAATPWTTSFMT